MCVIREGSSETVGNKTSRDWHSYHSLRLLIVYIEISLFFYSIFLEFFSNSQTFYFRCRSKETQLAFNMKLELAVQFQQRQRVDLELPGVRRGVRRFCSLVSVE